MAIDIRPDDVLIAVDVQYDFLPGGALAVPDGDAVIAPINALAERFAHVVLTQDWHPPGHASFASSHAGKAPFETKELHYGSQVLWPDHCVQGTRGAEIAAELRVPRAKLIIRKGTHPEVTATPASSKRTGARRRGSPAISRSGAIPASSARGSRPISAWPGRPSTRRGPASKRS